MGCAWLQIQREIPVAQGAPEGPTRTKKVRKKVFVELFGFFRFVFRMFFGTFRVGLGSDERLLLCAALGGAGCGL